MKRKILVALVAMSALLTVVPSPASAAPVRDTYLSLGTSLAAGTMADADGSNILFTNQSYTDKLATQLSSSEHVKLGCPGETVDTFINGGICYPGGEVTQLSLAQARLAQGDVDLVTIDLGANDFLNAQGDILACETEFCVFLILNKIAADVGGVIDALQAVDPDVQIVAMNYYNPNLATYLGFSPGVPGQGDPDPVFAGTSNFISTLANGLLERQFAARGVLVADVELEFSGEDFLGDDDGDGVPNNVEVICKWTSMCPTSPTAAPNIHANDDGYDRISDAFERVIADSE